MKSKMVVKNVTKKISLIIFLICVNNVFSQKTKYLLFNSSKDSIITVGKTEYYKIDKNLFNINRYNSIDTICKKKISEMEFTTVSNLWKEGKRLFLKVSDKKNLMLESYNQIFEEIYILEEISENKYKKTRVWWIDY